MERVAGIEPASSAWKAEVLPLNYTRLTTGGGGWIRTTEAYASDLQSDPFGHSGTPPETRAHIFLACIFKVNVFLTFDFQTWLYSMANTNSDRTNIRKG